MSWPWRSGNAVDLLENGEAFFPAVFEAIAEASEEVLIETFILFDDPVGRQLRERLIDAANRGVRCYLLLDGYGSPDLSDAFVRGMTEAGVEIRYFDPAKRLFGMRTNLFRRMHRKLVVVDRTVAFCGGINFSEEHLYDFGPLSKQDYAVRLRGPVVCDIRQYVWTFPSLNRRPGPVDGDARDALPAGNADVRFAVRDNHFCRTQIETVYLAGLRAARERVIIANAYFFPGYRMLSALRQAARRGVAVSLILQGQPDMPIAMSAARMVYGFLIKSGVAVYEYCERPLHGKVALVDDQWATVGSSNLDPLSLSLNLEANVVIRDRRFNAELARRLECLMNESCTRVEASAVPKTPVWTFLRGRLVFHFLRRFPAWFDLLPAHTPRLMPVDPPLASDSEPEPAEEGTVAPAAGSDTSSGSAPQ